MKKSIALLGLALASLACNAVHADVKPERTRLEGDPPKAVLWVGNSFFYYNNGMPNMYS